ncbi:hypothetical protein AURANDRAFT_67852 [Aureococcus anophagefferens]|uniref:Uncharacterized protein n=1 Tax=Aureococcus anophagefferens TaxID=44056 RepID=F0YML9_AURAN|nr:hypothetical protein AURANDRAFT_67852 [Aureococcus anophagefferens]EGB03646.1 hypothetical protein AURANDRAFT_67852 [Aureococcus anophagefferens]|eukprot:XP_009041648.1 hypothetical protein AURANDRAFT_67852 [Aureococcus anophagefferens]
MDSNAGTYRTGAMKSSADHARLALLLSHPPKVLKCYKDITPSSELVESTNASMPDATKRSGVDLERLASGIAIVLKVILDLHPGIFQSHELLTSRQNQLSDTASKSNLLNLIMPVNLPRVAQPGHGSMPRVNPHSSAPHKYNNKQTIASADIRAVQSKAHGQIWYAHHRLCPNMRRSQVFRHLRLHSGHLCPQQVRTRMILPGTMSLA